MSREFRLGRCFAGLVVAVTAAWTAAAAAPAKPSQVYVGTVKGGHASARLALVVNDGEFVAYVCGHDEDFNKANATWFRGKVTGGAIDASNDEKRTLKGTVADKKATLTLGGGKTDLTAEVTLVAADAVAGLYRDEAEVDDQTYTAGWIVDQDGTIAGAVRGPKQVATPKLPSAAATPKDVAKAAAPVGSGATAVSLQPAKLASPVLVNFRVTSVKNLGNTVGDDSTERIEIKWDIKNDIAPTVKEYIVQLTVTYGDGTTNSASKTVPGADRAAILRTVFKSSTPTKSFNVRLTAVPKDLEFGTVRTATKTGNF
jgi:hypothetical protein